MNWAGMLFGFGAMLAILGAGGAAFLRATERAVVAGALAVLGVAAMCLAMGSDFVALALGLLPGIALPGIVMVVLRVAPPPTPDVRLRAGIQWGTAALVFALFAVLAWAGTQTAWPPPGGPREVEAVWSGWRLLTDHLATFGALALLLCTASLVAVSLLRPRARQAGRRGPEGTAS